MKIVTHPGSAHPDELWACAALMTQHEIDSIERRDPTEDDLNDPETIVVDVGNRYEPERRNFDHHQPGFRRDCAFSLVVEAYPALREYRNRDVVFQLLVERVTLIDTDGAPASGGGSEYSRTRIAPLLQAEWALVEWFRLDPLLPAEILATHLRCQLAQNQLLEPLIEHLETHGTFREVKGLTVFDHLTVSTQGIPNLTLKRAVRLVTNRYERATGKKVAIIVGIVPDDARNPGHQVIFVTPEGRNAGVKLHLCTSAQGVKFIHPNRFLLVANAGANIDTLLDIATSRLTE